ncbi:carbohydrate-binding module family 13 protein, partial [Rhizoctonia solani]
MQYQGLPDFLVVRFPSPAPRFWLTPDSTPSQNVYINSVNDFCLWAPPYTDGHNSSVGQVEEIMVAWCLNDGYGTRLIPDGTITGAHFVQTPDYVQVTGWGDLTKLNIPKGDSGGADGLGNPHGGLVFGKSTLCLLRTFAYAHAETTGMILNTTVTTYTTFKVRHPLLISLFFHILTSPRLTSHLSYLSFHSLVRFRMPTTGCDWNIPANYTQGVFEDCQGDTGLPMGIYGSSTFQQGQGPTPAAHPIPPSSSCKFYSSVKNAVAGVTLAPTVPTAAAATTTVASVVPGSTATSTAASSTGGAVGRVASLGWAWAVSQFCLDRGSAGGTMHMDFSFPTQPGIPPRMSSIYRRHEKEEIRMHCAAAGYWYCASKNLLARHKRPSPGKIIYSTDGVDVVRFGALGSIASGNITGTASALVFSDLSSSRVLLTFYSYFTMADFFTSASTFVAPVDKSVTRKTEANSAAGMTNQTSEATQSTKTSGSNFSMCEIIM